MLQAALGQKEKQVNLKKLRSFLEKHKEFPSQYRPLIWRFLLQLPENAESFADLGNTRTHIHMYIHTYAHTHTPDPLLTFALLDRSHRWFCTSWLRLTSCACIAIAVRRGTHPCYQLLHHKYPIGNPRYFSRLQTICSSLAHWSSIFGEVTID